MAGTRRCVPCRTEAAQCDIITYVGIRCNIRCTDVCACVVVEYWNLFSAVKRLRARRKGKIRFISRGSLLEVSSFPNASLIFNSGR